MSVSNDKKITIIMPFLNEGEELSKTIECISQTAPSSLYEIIAIDDCSVNSVNSPNLQQYENVKYIRNPIRIGVDGSRQLGVDLAETPFILILDAHMRFKNDMWMERYLECMQREPETVWCTTCVALGYGSMDMNYYKGKYYGADMMLVDPKATSNRPAREVLEPKWARRQNKVEYEIPCVLGANYGFSKKWFDYIKGLQGLKMWGTSEPFLSMKTWMAGGKCKIRTDIEIGHKFREHAPYKTAVFNLIYNKIFLCKTILPKDLAEELIGYLSHDINYRKAMKLIDEKIQSQEIEGYRKYYDGIFKNSIYDYCDKFNITLI